MNRFELTCYIDLCQSQSMKEWIADYIAAEKQALDTIPVDQVADVTKAATWKLTDSDLSDIKNIIGDLCPMWIKDEVR